MGQFNISSSSSLASYLARIRRRLSFLHAFARTKVHEVAKQPTASRCKGCSWSYPETFAWKPLPSTVLSCFPMRFLQAWLLTNHFCHSGPLDSFASAGVTFESMKTTLLASAQACNSWLAWRSWSAAGQSPFKTFMMELYVILLDATVLSCRPASRIGECFSFGLVIDQIVTSACWVWSLLVNLETEHIVNTWPHNTRMQRFPTSKWLGGQEH